MNMKLKLRIAILFICLMYILMGASFYALFYGHQRALEKMTVAQNLALDIFERRYLADEYAAAQSERAKTQWFSEQKKIETKLADSRPLFQGDQEKDLLMRISDGIFSGERIFNQMVGVYDNEDNFSDLMALLEREKRLSSQLSTWTQESISAATDLTNLNNDSVVSNSRKMLYLFVSGASALFAMLIGSFWVIWRYWRNLYDQKTKNELILSGIGDGIIVMDRNWNIMLFNKAAGDLSGWNASEVIGRPFREIIKFVREKDHEENIEFIEQAMLFGNVRFMENHTVLVRKDGKEIPVGDSAAPLFSEDGLVVGVIIIFRDVTNERDANLLKSDFAYASHQFRTPLNKALWGLEAALDGVEDKTVRENILNSLASLKSVNKLSQALLEISEIDQKQVIPEMKRFGLGSVVRESVDMVKESAASAGIPVILPEINPEIYINTDPRLLKRCLYEILNNAVTYSRPGKDIRLGFELRGEEIILKISDSGPGISEKEQPLIFNKFFRGSNFNTTDVAGAGLGLYIVKNYINLIKGKVWFKSRENDGTEFFISLPLSGK